MAPVGSPARAIAGAQTLSGLCREGCWTFQIFISAAPRGVYHTRSGPSFPWGSIRGTHCTVSPLPNSLPALKQPGSQPHDPGLSMLPQVQLPVNII